MNRPRQSRSKTALLGLLAASIGLPMGIGQTDTRTQRTAPGSAQFQPASTQQKSAPITQAPATGASIGLIRGLDGMDSTVLPERRRSHTPYELGTSRACARMVRKNKLRARGISGQRI